MPDHVEALVEAVLRTDPTGLDQVGLQDRAVALHRAIGRLTGALDVLLGELDGRQDGMVVANPRSEGPALYQPVQRWWRDAAGLTGPQAGAQLRQAKVLRDLPVLSAAVVDGELAPDQGRALTRLHGEITLTDLQDSKPQLVQVAREARDRLTCGAARRSRPPHALGQHCATGAWTGPQTRARVEAALCDARISRVLLDEGGQVVFLKSLTDQITPAQRRAVSARDRHCVAKGCHRPPAFCDVHHLIHREHGGATRVENLALLGRRHHVLWHRGTIGLHDLHVPWLPDPDPEPDLTDHDPWDRHNPSLVA